MIAVHKRICYDDEGRLECVCRWSSPPAPSWIGEIPLTPPVRKVERLFVCPDGHKVQSYGTPDICMRTVRWPEPCLQPLTEVTE